MPDRRPFRWPDASILALSLLLGLVAAREWHRREAWDIEAALGLEQSMSGYEKRILDLPIPLAATTLGLGLATFRRPLGRRSLRSLGVATTGLASILIALVLVSEAASRRMLRGNSTINMVWDDVRALIGLAALILWVVLRIGGVRRRAVDVWDRMGRWLGWAWLVDLAFTSAGFFVARAFSP